MLLADAVARTSTSPSAPWAWPCSTRWADCRSATSAPGRLADVQEKFSSEATPPPTTRGRRADARVHAGLRDPVQQRLCGRERKVVSRVEYETLAAGAKLRPYRARRSRAQCRDDLVVDTIELGGDDRRADGGRRRLRRREFYGRRVRQLQQGTDTWCGQGAARVGEHYVARVPVIKKQTISAYDPRVGEQATGWP